MGLKCFDTNFSFAAKEKSIRYDVDFLLFQNEVSIKDYYSFNDFFDIQTNNKVNVGTLEGDFFYSEIGNISKNGDVEPFTLNFNKKNIEDQDLYKKIEKGDIISPQEKDILISKVRPNLKKFIYIDAENKKYFYTSAFIDIKPKKLSKIFYYAFRTIFYNNLITIARQGKGYPTLNEKDLLTLKFDKKTINLLMDKEQYILSKIDPIEKEIKRLKSMVIPPHQIINSVFSKEFNLIPEKVDELKRKQNIYINLGSFSRDKDLRCSFKFNSESSNFAYYSLINLTSKKIKDFIIDPIILGSSVKPSDYVENGTYRYLSMASIKNWKYDEMEAKFISNEYCAENQSRVVQENDIIIARSGEGTIGKVALIGKGVKAIFCDFTIRIRLRDYNPMFAYYYFRSKYFQELIYAYKKGLGNNTNIFPNQIQEFPMIDISLSEQQRIVNIIKAELDKQEGINNQIQEKRNQIDHIIQESVKN